MHAWADEEMSTTLECRDLTVVLGGKEVVSGINLTVGEGVFLGIVGPNGSGKTTLLKVLLGLVRPTTGTVKVFGREPQDVLRSGVFGYLPQHFTVDSSFPATALDVVLMGLQGRRGLFRRPSREDRKKAETIIGTMGMGGHEDQIFGALSGGQQQRVSIARALISDPKILILDEPSTGIDVVGQEDFYHLLKGIQKRQNLNIIMVSHDIGVITAYVDEIACLNRTLHYQGNPLGAFNDEVLKGLYGKSMEILMHDHLCDRCERLHPEDMPPCR
jgi:zinc transport system ATP-binding protein